LAVISAFSLEDYNIRRIVPTTSVSMHTPVAYPTAFISVKPGARYLATLTHVDGVLHNKEFERVLPIQDPFGMLRYIRGYGRVQGTLGSSSEEEEDV
jgi:hypothetical protein